MRPGIDEVQLPNASHTWGKKKLGSRGTQQVQTTGGPCGAWCMAVRGQASGAISLGMIDLIDDA